MPPAPHERPQPPRARARAGGFTLVEILVVMVIVAILMAAVVPRFMGAKSNTYAKEAKAAGAAYAQAISRYQADNYNKHPKLKNDAALSKGPVDLMGKPYLPGVPDAVTSGRVGVDVGVNCTNAKSATGVVGSHGQISICFGTEPNYAVRVATRTGPASTTWETCWLGSTGKKQRC